MDKNTQNLLNNISSNLVKLMSLEGTSKSPRKFSLGEITNRVNQAFLVSPNDKLEAIVLEKVTSELRDLGRIKKEQSNYTLPQSILSYRILNPKSNDNVIASLFNSGSYSIKLNDEELKEFRQHIEKPSDLNSNRWKIVTKKVDESGTLQDKEVTFSPNYS